MTTRQRDIMLAIHKCITATGVPPTIHELAAALGISRVTAYEHVKILLRDGHLTRQAGSRTRNLWPHETPSMRLAKMVLENEKVNDAMRVLAAAIASPSGGMIDRPPHDEDLDKLLREAVALVLEEEACP